MRTALIAILIIIGSMIYAVNVEQCFTMNNRVTVRLNEFRSVPDLANTEPNLLVTTQTYALPYKHANLQVNSIAWNVYDKNGDYIRTEREGEYNAVYIANEFSFREMNGITIGMKNQISDTENIRTLKSVDFDIVGYEPTPVPESVSAAFVKAYQKLAANYETSYLRNLPFSRPRLLIISHAALTPYITNFVNWKKSKGFEVFIKNRQDFGNNAISIRDSIRIHYNQYKCDYLLLLGDVTGAYQIPTNIYTSPDAQEHDADDNFYTMLTGNDYFPEMLVGRFSINGNDEFLTIANKTIKYEQAPITVDTSWMNKALVVAGNYSEQAPYPTTPVSMSRWLREKMLAKGFAQVDTVFYPPTYPGTASILASINSGVQYISYRGWGAADGWHYPSFHSSDLNNITTLSKLPIVFSIVCNTGDFASTLQNPCFGEKWMLLGTSSQQKGCVGFVGPSDLHTKTNLNNTISTGAFSSILDDGERIFGSSVLAGKIELYNNNPLDLGSNQNVAFYFHVYNILSDPSLNMWFRIPETISSSVIVNGNTFAQSDSYIEINAPHLNGATVTGTKNFSVYSYTTVHNGIAILPINPEESGNLILTISKENYVPLVTSLTPTLTPTVGVISNSLIGQKIYPGQEYSLTLTLKNYTENALNNITANLVACPADYVTIETPNQVISNIQQQGTNNITFTFTLHGNVPSRKIIRFDLLMPGLTTQSSFELITGGAEFAIINTLGNLDIGTSNNITFTIQNIGSYVINNASVSVQSLNTAAVINDYRINIGNVNVNETADFQIPISILSGCYNGRNILLYFVVSDPNGYQSSCYYSLVAGNPTTIDPTGPDQYGYFAYDSFDINHPASPSYQWIEIDPRDGGNESTNVQEIVDDGSYTVDLPFLFKFYGQDYDQMTICSNGWVSFVPTWLTDFNNLYIPAALGPYAMLAPYWDDLKGMKVMQDTVNFYFENMRICNWYDQANNRYIVEWNDAYSQYTINLLQNAHLEKFQLILYPNPDSNGDIVYQYHTITNPAVSSNYSTVGIENHLQNDGLTYSYANIYPASATPLQNGLAIKFTTIPPDSFVDNEDIVQSLLPFNLLQNYPNPFNPETRISFNLNTKSDVTLEIYNLKGQKIASLINGKLTKGHHEVIWNGRDDRGISVGSGVYVYKMNSGNITQTKKMMLMK